MIIDPTVGEARTPFDTASPEFRARTQWVCDHVGSAYPTESVYLAVTPEAHNSDGSGVQAMLHQYLNLVFAVPDNPPVAIDAEAVWLSPKAAVCGIAGVLGKPELAVWGPDYAPPPPALHDWEVPGSPIGAPFLNPGYPKNRFQFRYGTGSFQPGAVIAGPVSGDSYKLVLHGFGMFASYEWEKQ